MIKLVFCLRRRLDMDHDQFLEYWSKRHAPLVREVAPSLKIQRYTQNHGVAAAVLQPALDARASHEPPFDGVAELWWQSASDIIEVGATSDGRLAGRRLLQDERNFIDLARSPIFYVNEHVVFG